MEKQACNTYFPLSSQPEHPQFSGARRELLENSICSPNPLWDPRNSLVTNFVGSEALPLLPASPISVAPWNSSCTSWERLCWASQTSGTGYVCCFPCLPLRGSLMDKWGYRGAWQPWCFLSNVNLFYTFPLGLTFYLPGTSTALSTGCAKKENIEDCSGFDLLADLKGRMTDEKWETE